MAEMKNMKVEVVRYNPEVDIAPHSAFYEVPYDEQTSLLDALGYIKDNLAPDLSYRWSCRMAICGSCGMMVNKVPKLACKTFLREYTKGIKVEALANFCSSPKATTPNEACSTPFFCLLFPSRGYLLL